MANRLKQNVLLIISLTATLLFFQNCSGTFSPSDHVYSSETNEEAPSNSEIQEETNGPIGLTDSVPENGSPDDEPVDNPNVPQQTDNTVFPPVPQSPASKELCQVSSNDSALKKAARNLKAGDWAILPTQYDASSEREFFYSTPYPQTKNGANHISWADRASWDSESGCLHFFGGGHIVQPAFIRICEADLKWTYGSRPTTIDYDSPSVWEWTGHAYNNNTFDPQSRTHFIIKNNFIHAFDLQTGKWRPYKALPKKNSGYKSVVSYLPGSGVSLILSNFSGKSTLYLLKDETSEWETVVEDIENTMPSNPMSRYNSASETFIFGGGQKSALDGPLWKIDASKQITQISHPPFPFVSGVARGQTFVADPASGNFIFIQKSGQIYEYIVSQDRWVKKGQSEIAMNSARLSVPIPEYGVIGMYAYGIGFVLYNANREACP